MSKLSLYGHRLPDRRKRPISARKRWDLKQLWQHSHEILNLAAMGMKHNQIAKVVGVTPVTVSATVNSTLGREKLAIMRGARDADAFDTTKKIQELVKRSLELYETILDEESCDEDGNPLYSASLRFAVAKHVTNDLSGLKVPAKIDARVLHAHLTAEEIEELKRRGKEAAKEMGLVVKRDEGLDSAGSDVESGP